MLTLENLTLPHIGYTRIEPSASFKAYVDCYWVIDAVCTDENGIREFLFPNGGMGIIFNYGDALFFNKVRKNARAYLDGTNTHVTELVLNGRIHAVGIRFKPAGAFEFLGFALHEGMNQCLDMTDLGGSNIHALYDILPAKRSNLAKAQAIEHVLNGARIISKSIHPQIRQLIDLVNKASGTIPVYALARHIDMSERKLERIFKEQVGMPPRDFVRAIRVRSARNQLKKSNATIIDVALDLGFHDQAHFTRSFAAVVGLTPGEYIKRHRQRL